MLPRKIHNNHKDNRLNNEGGIEKSINKIFKNRNLDFLLKKRYQFISKFLNEEDQILELGCGSGNSKHYIKNKNLKISDITSYDFLDFKNVDCLNTKFQDESFDCVFSLSLIHHISNPIRLFNEVGRILKKKGRYIILDVNCSFFLKLVIILTRSEKYDLDVDVLDKNISLTDPNDYFDSNNAVPSLIFKDFDRFNSKLDFNFEIQEIKFQEFITFLNSGGVIVDAPYLPLNNLMLKGLDKFDNLLSKLEKLFPLHIYACITKID